VRLRAKKAVFAGKARSSLPKIVGGTLKKGAGVASFPSGK
jgi:hypothetical protein